ncbi:MAG: GNAT family N-acetyltransferase [Anaerolineales bacterium]|nr:GNAT family N-acetyltransferase [Anaerolineales bacterium]
MFIHTARLTIRNFKDSDIDAFLAYRNDPEVAKYQGWGIPYTREQGLQYISEIKDIESPKAGLWLQVAIELKETGETIGDLGIRIKKEDARQVAIGFTIASTHWRKGYAVEAMTALLEYLFKELNMHRVIADCDVENIASYRTLEKLGFRREAHFVESFFADGVYTSEYYYGLLQSEWSERDQV